jgi:DNA-binding MarR family transcriptional regulator
VRDDRSLGAPAGAGSDPPTHDEVVDAVLAATRMLVAIAARSVAATDEDVTLAQYRALVVLCYNGPQRTIDLAEELGVGSSTATRMVDRLVRRTLVQRTTDPQDRRATSVAVTDAGRAVVEAVTARRRAEFSQILRKMQPDRTRRLVDGLEAMREAAGEAPEQTWTLGWTS